MGKITGDFIGNVAYRGGGAVYTTSTKNFIIEGNFINNHANYGGAVANYNNTGNNEFSQIYNSSFYNNTADRKKSGGAIYHVGALDIVASGYDSVFQGNTSGSVGNAIYTANNQNPSELNLIATNGGSINFYDDLDGDQGYKLNLSGDSSGKINFHANVNNADIVIGRENTTRAVSEPVNVNFDSFTNFSNHNNSLKMNNGVLTVDDFALDRHRFRKLEFAGGEFNINNVDVDLANAVMGRFIADEYAGGNGVVKVHNLTLKSDGGTFTAVDFADVAFSRQVESNTTVADGPVYSYAVNYLPESGRFTFQRTVVNEAVKLPSYAAVTAVSVLSDEIYSRVLADAGSYFNDSGVRNGIKPFVKTFGANDHIDIKHFNGGDSEFYGIIIGLETSPQVTDSGWKAVYNTYLAYAGGEYKYATDLIDQNSGYFGVSGVFYKEAFFIGTTINAAVMENKSRDAGENNKFTSYLGGIGLKTGYDYALGKGVVLQPNLYGSYTYIRSDDYKTSNNARVKFGGMHNYELAPGLKLSKKFATGTGIYAKGRYVFNFNEGQKAMANDIRIPAVELKNYAEFGLGAEQDWPDNGGRVFMEITRREGGREGWNGLVGAKWAF